jgi:hypothetical protein
MDIPSGKHTKSELEHGPVEIVDFDMNSMGGSFLFSFFIRLSVYRRPGNKSVPTVRGWDAMGWQIECRLECQNKMSGWGSLEETHTF